MTWRCLSCIAIQNRNVNKRILNKAESFHIYCFSRCFHPKELTCWHLIIYVLPVEFGFVKSFACFISSAVDTQLQCNIKKGKSKYLFCNILQDRKCNAKNWAHSCVSALPTSQTLAGSYSGASVSHTNLYVFLQELSCHSPVLAKQAQSSPAGSSFQLSGSSCPPGLLSQKLKTDHFKQQ